MAKGGMPDGVKSTISWALGLGVVALILLVMLILFGNLSGNVGFDAGSQGYNDTQSVILNYTTSATNTSSQFPTVGTILGVAILLIVLIAILVFAVRKLTGVSGGLGSNSSFG